MPYWATPASLCAETAPPGTKDGDLVTLTSEWGTITVPARLDEHMRPGYAAVPTGGGHTGFGRWAKYGANVMTLLRPGPAPVTGANVQSDVRVRLERAQAHGAGKEV